MNYSATLECCDGGTGDGKNYIEHVMLWVLFSLNDVLMERLIRDVFDKNEIFVCQ